MSGKRTEELAVEILNHFKLTACKKNKDFLINKLYRYVIGADPIKVVSFDESGVQKNVFLSIRECANYEGVKYNTIHNSISTGAKLRKTGLRYCKLSDFGKFKIQANDD